MRYFALATDYDGTLATHGYVSQEVVEALKAFKASGRKLILVTGRELPELKEIFPEIGLFQLVVAENGALLYWPENGEEKVLCKAPPENFYERLIEKNVAPVSRGKVIIATWTPHETVVLSTIKELNLELQVIFNKGAVMVLPAGVNKAFGLQAALKELNLSPQNIVGIGDAENDHSFLEICACSVTVSNALQSLKERSDFTTKADHGAGVIELINLVLSNDMRNLEENLLRARLTIGKEESGEEIYCGAFGTNILVAGSSGGGKSTFATGFLERLVQQGYQFCIIDPEGDYEAFQDIVSLGSSSREPEAEEVVRLLEHPGKNASVNLISVPFEERPRIFLSILSRLQDLRAKVGRPHWIVVDEAHHVLPAKWHSADQVLPQIFSRMMFITIRPKELVAPALESITHFLGFGEASEEALTEYLRATSQEEDVKPLKVEKGTAIFRDRRKPERTRKINIVQGEQSLKRHRRKYAEGALPPERSFYFTGKDMKLNLRAHNLIVFNQLSQGIDEDTWSYHLKQGDYSKWFKEAIKDEQLSEEAAKVEQSDLNVEESKTRIKKLIDEMYTLPAETASPKSAPS